MASFREKFPSLECLDSRILQRMKLKIQEIRLAKEMQAVSRRSSNDDKEKIDRLAEELQGMIFEWGQLARPSSKPDPMKPTFSPKAMSILKALSVKVKQALLTRDRTVETADAMLSLAYELRDEMCPVDTTDYNKTWVPKGKFVSDGPEFLSKRTRSPITDSTVPQGKDSGEGEDEDGEDGEDGEDDEDDEEEYPGWVVPADIVIDFTKDVPRKEALEAESPSLDSISEETDT